MYEPEELVRRHKGLRVSSLSYFRKSPRYCKDRMDEKAEDIDTSYFDLGTKLHYFLLEPQKFNDLYIYLDFPVPKTEQQKTFCENAAKYSKTEAEKDAILKAYKDAYVAKGKTDKVLKTASEKMAGTFRKYINYLAKSDTFKDTLNFTTFKFLEEARNSVMKHKKARELMLPSPYSTSSEIANDNYIEENEARIYWEFPGLTVNGESIVCRSTLDRLIIDHTNKVVKLIDLKTTSTLYKFEEKFEAFSYHEQLAFYWYAIGYMFSKLYPDKKLSEYKKETYIVAVQSNTSQYAENLPIECKVFSIQEDWLTKADDSIRDTLGKMVWHFENDKWDYIREYYEGDGTEQL